MIKVDSSPNCCQKPVKKIKFDLYKIDKIAPNDVFLMEWQNYWHARKKKQLKVVEQYIMEERRRVGKNDIPKVNTGFMIDCDYWEMQSKEWQKKNPELCEVPYDRWRYKFFEVDNVKCKNPFCTIKWKITIVEGKNEPCKREKL